MWPDLHLKSITPALPGRQTERQEREGRRLRQEAGDGNLESRQGERRSVS